MNQSTTQMEPLELLILMALKQHCKIFFLLMTVLSKLVNKRYKDIEILQVFDAEGEITSYIRSVGSDIYPHFFGPG